MDPINKTLISLARAAVNEKVPDAGITDSLDMNALEQKASDHQIAALISCALESAGIDSPQFTQAYFKAVRKNMLLDADRAAITGALEKAGIWYMALKGVVLKEYYPQFGMREMSDNDILFDAARADEVRSIMESLGFETMHFGTGHQDDYQKPPVSHFEMHRALIPDSHEEMFAYYRNVSERLKSRGGYERFFTPEDFYIYMIVHESKHFYWRGTGLRSLLDVYVFLRQFENELDWDYICTEMDKLGLTEFEEKNRSLTMKVFREDADLLDLDEEEKEMLEYFASSGAFGTKSQEIRNTVQKIGKKKYILQRIFPSMENIKKYYPVFYEHKILLPLLPVYRLIRYRKQIRMEIKAIRKEKNK